MGTFEDTSVLWRVAYRNHCSWHLNGRDANEASKNKEVKITIFDARGTCSVEADDLISGKTNKIVYNDPNLFAEVLNLARFYHVKSGKLQQKLDELIRKISNV